jgi:hypothetical protein
MRDATYVYSSRYNKRKKRKPQRQGDQMSLLKNRPKCGPTLSCQKYRVSCGKSSPTMWAVSVFIKKTCPEHTITQFSPNLVTLHFVRDSLSAVILLKRFFSCFRIRNFLQAVMTRKLVHEKMVMVAGLLGGLFSDQKYQFCSDKATKIVQRFYFNRSNIFTDVRRR